jgi:hypothetical protein
MSETPGHRLRFVPILALLGVAFWFRLMRLSSVPGISGDEAWWGIQALAWSAGKPYETHTTSGNPIDMFFLVPVAFVHLIAPPSFLLLRVVPTVVNLLALPVGFWFVRRLYGCETAWIYTVTLALLPTAVAHSRICQDPSQSIFWTGIFIFICLLGLKDRRRAWRYLAAGAAIFPIVLWTHPTNVFAAPFLLLPAVAAIEPLMPASPTRRAGLVLAAVGIAALAMVVVAPVLRHLPLSNQYLDQPWLSTALARAIDARQWLEFGVNNARLFNGVTIYHYFSGATPSTLLHDAGFVLAMMLTAGGVAMMPAARRSPLDYGLIAACAMMWIGFYLFAGPAALRPHFERWGLCLIVPGLLVVARGIAAWRWIPRLRWVADGAAPALLLALTVSFYVNYFDTFDKTGGRSHLTYVTASVEPKQQAFDRILARSPGPGSVAVGSTQWWLYRPLAYLATPYPNVTVTASNDVTRQPGYAEAVERGRLFFVEFSQTPELATTRRWVEQHGLREETTLVRDASGRTVVEILQVSRP